MSQEMYGASGKVGNKVYYRANGKTVSRELVTPKNPKTDKQTLQRVIVSQVGKSYQKFMQICNHSYEGVTMGAQCAARFRKLNLDYCRSRATEIQQSGNSLAQFYNFQPIGSPKWVPGAVILSQGQLPSVDITIGQNTGGEYIASVNIEANTYADVIRALGLKRGDQLTFVGVSKFQGDYSVHYARIILDPRNADGSGAALTSAFIGEDGVNLPNWKNTGSFEILNFSGSEVQFKIGRGIQAGAAIIVSRQNKKGEWLRNNTTLTLSEEAMAGDLMSLWEAMENSYAGGSLDVESEYYLNNAGVGGSQGAPTQTGGGSEEPGTPSYNNSVAVNGVNQNVSGGSVGITAPFNTVTVTGTYLADSTMFAQKQGSDAKISPTAKTATTISFTGLNGAAGERFNFYKAEGQLWFTVIVSAGGSDDPTNDDE